MDNVETRIQNTAHQKSQAIWLLNELNREASAALSKFGIMETTMAYVAVYLITARKYYQIVRL